MNRSCLWTISSLALLCGGCQPLAPGSSQQLVRSAQDSAPAVDARDDDTFGGRLRTGTKQLADSASKPFDPTYWQQVQHDKAVAKQRQKRQEAAAAKRQRPKERSPVMAWLFPEPKKPRTLSEWLSQERPES